MSPSWQIARDNLIAFLEFAWHVLHSVMFMSLPTFTREAMRQYLVEMI